MGYLRAIDFSLVLSSRIPTLPRGLITAALKVGGNKDLCLSITNLETPEGSKPIYLKEDLFRMSSTTTDINNEDREGTVKRIRAWQKETCS